MTEEQIILVKKARNLAERIKQLNVEINLLQLQYREITNQLYDTIEPSQFDEYKKIIKK